MTIFNGKPRVRRRWRIIAPLALVTLTCLGASVNDVLFVNRVSVPVREGKYAFDKVLGTALRGDQLTVTKVEGRWLKVRYVPRGASASKPSSVEGYVMLDALSAREVEAATTRDTGNAAELGAAGAGRGLLDSTKYAASKGLSRDPFNKMVDDSRAAMAGADQKFEEFCREGRIGTFNPKRVFAPVTAPATAP